MLNRHVVKISSYNEFIEIGCSVCGCVCYRRTKHLRKAGIRCGEQQYPTGMQTTITAGVCNVVHSTWHGHGGGTNTHLQEDIL